ncbi:hypothetical protein PFISCL1PPCAC_5313, partial [Pristionchus fissidentatus]
HSCMMLNNLFMLLIAAMLCNAQTFKELNETLHSPDVVYNLVRLARTYYPDIIKETEVANISIEFKSFAENEDSFVDDYPILASKYELIKEKLMLALFQLDEDSEDFVEYVADLLGKKRIFNTDSTKMIQNISDVCKKANDRYATLSEQSKLQLQKAFPFVANLMTMKEDLMNEIKISEWSI